MNQSEKECRLLWSQSVSCALTKVQLHVDGQAVALQVPGDKASFYSCSFFSTQDMLCSHKHKEHEQTSLPSWLAVVLVLVLLLLLLSSPSHRQADGGGVDKWAASLKEQSAASFMSVHGNTCRAIDKTLAAAEASVVMYIASPGGEEDYRSITGGQYQKNYSVSADPMQNDPPGDAPSPLRETTNIVTAASATASRSRCNRCRGCSSMTRHFAAWT